MMRKDIWECINPTEGGELRAKPVFKTIRHNSLMESLAAKSARKGDAGSKPAKCTFPHIFFNSERRNT